MTFDEYHAALSAWWAEVYLDREALPPAPADSGEFRHWWERRWPAIWIQEELQLEIAEFVDLFKKRRRRLPVAYLTGVLRERWQDTKLALNAGGGVYAYYPQTFDEEGGDASQIARSSPTPDVYVDVGGTYLLDLDLYSELEVAVDGQVAGLWLASGPAKTKAWNELARQWMAEREEEGLRGEERDPYHSGPADDGRSLCLEMR